MARCSNGASDTVKGRVLAITGVSKMEGSTVFNVVFRDGSDTIRVSVWGEKLIPNYIGKFEVTYFIKFLLSIMICTVISKNCSTRLESSMKLLNLMLRALRGASDIRG